VKNRKKVLLTTTFSEGEGLRLPASTKIEQVISRREPVSFTPGDERGSIEGTFDDTRFIQKCAEDPNASRGIFSNELTRDAEGLKKRYPSALGYLPYFAELPDISDFFYVPTPAFGLRFIKESVDYPIDVLEYPTRKEYRLALESGYDIVGISFMTFKTYEALLMAKEAKECGVKEVWGGGYGVDTPAGLERYFDRLIRGHGEEKVSLLLTGNARMNKRHPVFIMEAKVGFYEFKIGYLISSMGCNMGCTFCHATTYMPKRVEVDIAEIERVLDIYVENGVAGVLLYDDNFSVRSEHARRVVDLLHERQIPFWFECRADDILGKVHELAEKGLFGICMGVESLRQQDLDSSRKRETTKQILSCINELKENDIWFMTTYMLGWEDYTPESIERDLERISSLGIPYFQAMIITPFPGTLIWKDWQDIITDRNWSHYDHQHLVFNHPNLTAEEASKALNRCYEMLTAETAISTLDAWEKKFGHRISS